MTKRDIAKGIKLKTKKGLDAQAISQAIEQGFLKKRRPEKDWTQKTTFSPSTIAYGHGTCPRYWYLAFNGVENFADTTDALGLANMSYGTKSHEDIQEALEAEGLLVDSEVEITLDDPPVHGFLDIIMRWEDEELVGEIKTTRQESFVFKELNRKPSANHLIQLLIYMYATQHDRGFLVYLNKNDQTFIVLPVEMDEANKKILNNVFSWLREVYQAYQNQTLPIIPFNRSRATGFPENKICAACPVREACFASPTGDVKISRMEIPQL